MCAYVCICPKMVSFIIAKKTQLDFRLRVYYAYGYGRIAATTTGVLQAYYGLAAGCKLTSGHYNRER